MAMLNNQMVKTTKQFWEELIFWFQEKPDFGRSPVPWVLSQPAG